MRIAYASDLHGETAHYEALFSLAKEKECGAVILGGDLSPKKFSRSEIIPHHRNFYETFLLPLIERHKHERPDLKVYVIMGNDDCAPNARIFENRPDLMTWIHGKTVELEPGLLLSGYSCVDITPFYLKDWERWDSKEPRTKVRSLKGGRSKPDGSQIEAFAFPETPCQTIEEELAPKASELGGKDFIWVAHCPPHDSNLDKMAMGVHVGSDSIRRFIEKSAPLISLHGHIHESPRMTGSFKDQIGRTLSVNAGQDWKFLHAVTFDTADPAGTIRHTRE
ncbi:MAG: metallophosphoesterase [Bdellovibrionota bacterium]